jgi:hypothetical protein
METDSGLNGDKIRIWKDETLSSINIGYYPEFAFLD